jgi:membrane-associated phospholipid phosphatase
MFLLPHPSLALAVAGLLAATAWHLWLPPSTEGFVWLNQLASALPAAWWGGLTHLGDTQIALALMLPLMLWRATPVLALVAAIPVGGLGSLALKAWFDSPRPAALLPPDAFHVIGGMLTQHSFPSGHSITAFAVAAAVWLGLQHETQSPRIAQWVRVGVLALAGLAAASRVAVGAHWPVDVLGGACFGWLAGASGVALLRWRPGFWYGRHCHHVVLALGLLLAYTGWSKHHASVGGWVAWLALVLALFAAGLVWLGRWREGLRR